MLTPALLLLGLLQLPSVLARQIPLYEGIIGAVTSSTNSIKPKNLDAAATTPGKLRIVENSGICGKVFHHWLLLH